MTSSGRNPTSFQLFSRHFQTCQTIICKSPWSVLSGQANWIFVCAQCRLELPTQVNIEFRNLKQISDNSETEVSCFRWWCSRFILQIKGYREIIWLPVASRESIWKNEVSRGFLNFCRVGCREKDEKMWKGLQFCLLWDLSTSLCQARRQPNL